MKAKHFLNLSETRPTWAKVADSLIETCLHKKWNLNQDSKYQNIFIFLQILSANTKEHQGGLLTSIRQMLRTAEKHGITLPSTGMSPMLKLNMPIWHHTRMTGMKYQGYNTATAKCQRKHYNIKTVGDLLNLIKQVNSILN